MNIENLLVKDIKPYWRNAKKHTPAQIEKVIDSIKQFGFNQPIVVDSSNVIIAGHARFIASQKMGLAEVPVFKATHLTPEQVKAYRLADNKISEGAWDMEKVISELRELEEKGFKIDVTGFDLNEGSNISNDNCTYPIVPVFGEKYDYVIVFSKNGIDTMFMKSIFGITKQCSYKSKNVGEGHVIDVEELKKKWKS